MSPTLKVYSDPKSFWQEVSPFLKREESKNSLCLGLSLNFLNDSRGCFYQAALFDQEVSLGAVVGSAYLNHRNLLVTPVKDSTHAKILFDAAIQADLKITGVVGEATTVDHYRHFFEQSGKPTKTHMAHGIYRCSDVKLPTIAKDLVFRLANSGDLEKLGEWIEEFYLEAVPHDPPVNGIEVAQAKVNQKMIFVLEQGQELLSMAAWSRDLGSSCSINFVFTPRNCRKKGFGSIVTGLLTQHLLNQGKKETNLYTDMSNPTSNKIYQQLGYQFVCNSVHLGIIK